MPTLNPMILTLLSSPSLVCWLYFFPVWFFIHWHLLSWCQQPYSSVWRIPSGTPAEMGISWNCLKSPSVYMLRVEWGRRWRQTSMFWIRETTRISRQSFICLLLNIISVRFIVFFCTQHIWPLFSPKYSPRSSYWIGTTWRVYLATKVDAKNLLV